METIKTIKAIGIILGCPSELDGKVILLKMPHTLVTGHGKIKLVMARKHCPYWIAFIVLDGAM